MSRYSLHGRLLLRFYVNNVTVRVPIEGIVFLAEYFKSIVTAKTRLQHGGSDEQKWWKITVTILKDEIYTFTNRNWFSLSRNQMCF